MPTLEQHIAQWRHNRRVAQSIDRKFRDWQITVIFYAALHAVDASLSHLNLHVTNHESRNNAVRNNATLANLRNQYLDLYRISKITRYDADPDLWIPRRYLTVSDIVQELLPPIESEVERIIGKNLGLSPVKLET